jgi:FKBP-type peptidyl-prolyl cis-trans isomerase FkpA
LLDGTEFDSSLKPGRTPFEFTIGQGMVIKGWDEGIPMFKVGGKGKLLIPANLGYGENEQGSIPANSVLIFDIELLGVN